MPARVSSRKRQKQSHSLIARCARAVSPLLVAVIMLSGMIFDAEDHQSLPLAVSVTLDAESEVFILTITESESSAIPEAPEAFTEDEHVRPHSREACLLEATPGSVAYRTPVSAYQSHPSADDALVWTGAVGQF